MIKLFFDIETIPCEEEKKAVFFALLKKKNGNLEKSDEELHHGMSFDGAYGRICCIGVIKEGPQGILFKETLKGTEKEMLTKFWELSVGVWRFVGHNVWGFDMPFLVQRSIVNGVKPLPINFRRYAKEPLFDTMLEWTFWAYEKEKIPTLDKLAKVLDLPTSKDEMDGSMVWQYYQDGRLADICRYCMKDVELTRQVYYKMTFEQPAPTLQSSEVPTTDEIPF